MFRSEGWRSRKSAERSAATRARVRKKRSQKKGLPPGTPVYIGKERTGEPKISVMGYKEEQIHEADRATPDSLATLPKGLTATWINVDGVHQVEAVEQICNLFNLHRLVVEDIVNTTQSPKIEDYGEYLFVVLRSLDYDEQQQEMVSAQISLVVGASFVLSFQEKEGDEFLPLKERIRTAGSRLRKSGPDFLAYSMLDIVVDEYFSTLEKVAEKIELVEDELVTNPSRDTVQVIHKLKMVLIGLRRSVWPLREVVNKMIRWESKLVSDQTRPYLRDVYDHTIHVADTIEMFRDMVSGMLDIYLSSVSYRLNEIMKVLTVIATIFIPLTFLSGWYGMNFKDMPELGWKWGYPMVIGIALSMVSGMLIYFWRKRWL